MNIYKVVEGVSDTSTGALDCLSEGMPIINTVKEHKANLEKEGAGTAKKVLFLTGYSLLGFLEHWDKMKHSVMKTKDGVIEVYEGIKEPGLSSEEFNKEKSRIDDKRKEACQIYLPKETEKSSTGNKSGEGSNKVKEGQSAQGKTNTTTPASSSAKDEEGNKELNQTVQSQSNQNQE